MFEVGQKVVCVDVSPMGRLKLQPAVREGCVYTIRAFGEDGCDGATVFLMEIEARHERFGYGFWLKRFRPLVLPDTTAAVEALKALIAPVKQREMV